MKFQCHRCGKKVPLELLSSNSLFCKPCMARYQRDRRAMHREGLVRAAVLEESRPRSKSRGSA